MEKHSREVIRLIKSIPRGKVAGRTRPLLTHWDDVVYSKNRKRHLLYPKELTSCGYRCTPECKLLKATRENDVKLKEEVYKEWKWKENHGDSMRQGEENGILHPVQRAQELRQGAVDQFSQTQRKSPRDTGEIFRRQEKIALFQTVRSQSLNDPGIDPVDVAFAGFFASEKEKPAVGCDTGDKITAA